MTNAERLKAAGWRVCSVPGFQSWTRDRISWHTEDEALVVVLTAERDEAHAKLARIAGIIDFWSGMPARHHQTVLDIIGVLDGSDEKGFA